MKHAEALEQERVISFCRQWSRLVPELALLIHIPNGGRRDPREAAHLKRQGVKAGVSDLFLPVARKGKHGLWIEMKAGKNKPTQDQLEWLAAMERQGYAAAVCYSAIDAEDQIMRYLEQGRKCSS